MPVSIKTCDPDDTGLVSSKGVVCEWLWCFRNPSMWSSYLCCHVFLFLLWRPGLSISMRHASITHDLCAEGVCRHIGWLLAKGLGPYLQVIGYDDLLFPDWQGSFKDPRPITPIRWAVLLRLSLHSVFVCHKCGPMVGNTTCSIGSEVRIEENRLLCFIWVVERGVWPSRSPYKDTIALNRL